jgi:hypothetical protein
MGIFRSTDPTTWDDVDGIIINESAPAPNVQGVASNVALLVGTAERGLPQIETIGSTGDLYEKLGKSSFGINLALKNKKFGSLKTLRVVASGAVQALKLFEDGTDDIITFKAKQGKGAFGNNIQVKIEAGSSQGSKYTIKDTTANGVLPQEVYDNVLITAASTAFSASSLIEVVVHATTAEPDVAAFTALATGSDGTVADSDYQAALATAELEGVCNIVFLDSYNSTRNGYLKTHCANTQDRMAIMAGAEGDSVSTVISDVASLRDTEGRLIFAYNHVQSSVDGSLSYSSPAHWLASIISQLPPQTDPATVQSAAFMAGATGLKMNLSRANYIALKDAGICAFENDSDIGIKPKSGVVTQIADSSKVTILRRRMADYLTNSVAKFLKNYQNAVNSKQNRTLVGGAIQSFVKTQQILGILPTDADISEGKVTLVDTESQNTSGSIAAGYFKILWRQRIFSSMRYIVLSAEIGESVVVTES